MSHRWIWVLVGLHLLYIESNAQNVAVSTITFDQAIKDIAVDKNGQFYVLQVNGMLEKYSIEGRILYREKYSRHHQLDPSLTGKIFLFHRKKRTYQWLSPSLELQEKISIDPSVALKVEFACTSTPTSIWVYDMMTHTIKKIDNYTSQTISEWKLDKDLVVKKIQEYQQLVFIMHPNGISIYDHFGHVMQKIETPNIDQYNFIGEELYFIEQDRLVLIDLYTLQRRSVSLPEKCEKVLVLPEHIVCFQTKTAAVYLFSVKPQ